MKTICVYGSINADMILTMDELPLIGNNVVGNEYYMTAGGKGANQAAAAAKLGANVSLISMVGYDQLGRWLVERMRRLGVGVKFVGKNTMKTGINFIVKDSKNNKSMMFFTESNSLLDEKYLQQCGDLIDNSQMLMLQLSVPISGIELAAKKMKQNNGIVILDPSPAKKLKADFLKNVDYITPNDEELMYLSGIDDISKIESRYEAGKTLLAKGVGCVINKAGKDGAYIITKENIIQMPAFDIEVKDNVGVGSAFNGALAVSIALDKSIEDAVEFANAASAIMLLRGGTQDSMANYEECSEMIKGNFSLGNIE